MPESPYDRYIVSQSQMKLSVDIDQVDPLFLYYVFSSDAMKGYVQQHAIQAGVPHTNLGILRDTPILLPSVPEQKAIAHILGILDDKIELNRRMNRTLEEMARTLFMSWFVDFDPVRAKAAGRAPGLPKYLADLFPDFYEQSPLGLIPGGWQTLKWGSLVSLQYGKALKGYDSNDGTCPVFGTNGRIGTTEIALCDHPGIIVGRKGAYRGIHYCESPFDVIDTAFYVEPLAPVDLRWAYYELLRRDINSLDSGSAIPSTSREDFYAIPVLAPQFELQQAFSEFLEPMWKKQRQNEKQSRFLGSIRDTLLPKLLSGEVRIQEANEPAVVPSLAGSQLELALER